MNEQITAHIDTITEALYQQKTAEAYEMLGNFITLLMNELKAEKLKVKEMEEFNAVLLNAMNAMENQEAVLLADILNYELRECFN